jgi:16S rRNA (guanine527-N7)-methyltransferase
LSAGAGAAGRAGGAAPEDGPAEDVEAPARLAEICAQLGLSLGPTQQRQLLDFLALLQRWGDTYNLTAVREPAQMLTVHLADCLAAAAALERYAGVQRPPTEATPALGRILDVGSGAGLPGVVLAIARPQTTVVCADSVAKKAAFVRQVAGTLQLPNLQAVHDRVEQLRTAPFELVTARAFASLKDLVKATRHLLSPRGVWAAMKGQLPQAELDELPPGIDVFHVEQLAVPGLDASRCLVWMRPRPLAAAAGGPPE